MCLSGSDKHSIEARKTRWETSHFKIGSLTQDSATMPARQSSIKLNKQLLKDRIPSRARLHQPQPQRHPRCNHNSPLTKILLLTTWDRVETDSSGLTVESSNSNRKVQIISMVKHHRLLKPRIRIIKTGNLGGTSAFSTTSSIKLPMTNKPHLKMPKTVHFCKTFSVRLIHLDSKIIHSNSNSHRELQILRRIGQIPSI